MWLDLCHRMTVPWSCLLPRQRWIRWISAESSSLPSHNTSDTNYFLPKWQGIKWANNGPDLLTRCIKHLCKISYLRDRRANYQKITEGVCNAQAVGVLDICKDLTILDQTMFLPLQASELTHYFEPNTVHEFEKVIFAIYHLSGRIS